MNKRENSIRLQPLLSGESLMWQGMRYVAMGGLAFLTEFSVLYLLHETGGLGIGTSAVLSSVTGFFVSFNLQQFFSFNGQAGYRVALFKYSVLAGVNLVLSTTLIVLLDVLLDWKVAKLAATLILVLWNFLVYKYFVFTKSSQKLEAQLAKQNED